MKTARKNIFVRVKFLEGGDCITVETQPRQQHYSSNISKKKKKQKKKIGVKKKSRIYMGERLKSWNASCHKSRSMTCLSFVAGGLHLSLVCFTEGWGRRGLPVACQEDAYEIIPCTPDPPQHQHTPAAASVQRQARACGAVLARHCIVLQLQKLSVQGSYVGGNLAGLDEVSPV